MNNEYKRHIQEIRDLDERIQEIESEISDEDRQAAIFAELVAYKGDHEVIPSTKILEMLDKAPSRRPSGWGSLDRIIEGFAEENLVVVSGPTGQGKTLWCQNLTAQLSEGGIRCLWVSYELSLKEFLERFDNFPNPPVFYTPNMNVPHDLVWLERKIVEAMAKFEVQAVFIDHTHYLADMREIAGRNASLVIGALIRDIKLLARKYHIIIFLVHHMQKTDIDEAPTIADLRDTSFAAQEADFVIMIWRKMRKQSRRERMEEGIQYLDEMIVSVVKNRSTGRLGTLTMLHNKGYLLEADAPPRTQSSPKDVREDVPPVEEDPSIVSSFEF